MILLFVLMFALNFISNVSMSSETKVIKIFIRESHTELKEGDPPQNLTISAKFRIEENYDSSMIKFMWFIDNELISDRLKISNDASFACTYSVVNDDHKGSVLLNIYNIDKAFSRSIYLKASYTNESIKIETEKKIDVLVTKKYLTVSLRTDDPIKVVVGENVKLDISEVLKKQPGEPEISFCAMEIYKVNNQFLDVFQFSRTVPESEMFLNASDNELVLKSSLPND